jgi:hypothetical protein
LSQGRPQGEFNLWAPFAFALDPCDDELAARTSLSHQLALIAAIAPMRLRFMWQLPREATMTEPSDVLDFEPDQFVNAYRVLIGLRDAAELGTRGHLVATISLMRQKWKIWQGEDSLHEMAFGEPA